jgi:tRNA pseudouridine32 synthase/23S rRNA pseudouridine746 synthase
VLEFLIDRYPGVASETWLSRMAHGEVVDENGQRLNSQSIYRAGACIFYYRELETEPQIPFPESIIYEDENLLVVDKPHFLPVVPAGRFLHETLLVRLRNQGQPDSIVPVHRLDRETAGIVIFSSNAATRGRYTALFRERRVEKRYEALAPALYESDGVRLPATRRSRIVRGEPFFRMREIDGEPNAETSIEVIEQAGDLVRYELRPLTGKKHQLRVHMAALGIPILNDRLYPDEVFVAHSDREDNFARPLKLLARSVAFEDPVTSELRFFESPRRLAADCEPQICANERG